MSVLGRSLVPRILLGIDGVFLVLLFAGNLQSIVLFGLTPELGLWCAFSGLLAVACFWAAAGKTEIFRGKGWK